MAQSRSAMGAEAERRVAQFLTDKYAYRIVERNYRSRFGEVDIIAEEGDVLCFVEVRTRTSSRYGEALETVNAQKRRRISLSAHQYLVTRGLEHRACRFDVVTVQDGGEPQLLRDAFELDE